MHRAVALTSSLAQHWLLVYRVLPPASWFHDIQQEGDGDGTNRLW